MTKKEIGNEISMRIFQKMQDKNISIYELSKKTGIFTGTIDNSLRAKGSWKSAINLYKICEAVGLSLDFALSGNNKEENYSESSKTIIKELRYTLEKVKIELEDKKKKLNELRYRQKYRTFKN